MHEHRWAALRHRHAEHDHGEKGEHHDRGAYTQSTHKSPKLKQFRRTKQTSNTRAGLLFRCKPRLFELSHWPSGLDTCSISREVGGLLESPTHGRLTLTRSLLLNAIGSSCEISSFANVKPARAVYW